MAFSPTSRSVSGCITTEPLATATRWVTAFAPTSTMLALPSASTWESWEPPPTGALGLVCSVASRSALSFMGWPACPRIHFQVTWRAAASRSSFAHRSWFLRRFQFLVMVLTTYWLSL